MDKMKKPNPSIPNPNIQPNQVYANKEIYMGNDLAIGNYKQSRGPIRDKIGPYNAPTSSGDVISCISPFNSSNLASVFSSLSLKSTVSRECISRSAL